jgi:hypothetical protein
MLIVIKTHQYFATLRSDKRLARLSSLNRFGSRRLICGLAA